MKLPCTEVAAIEAATREQSNSALWQIMRNGRLTSSTFGEILKCQQTTDSRRLVKDIMGYNGPMKKVPPQICWGKIMKTEFNSATLRIGNDVVRIWKLRSATCTSCLKRVLLEPPQMAKYFVEMLTLAVRDV